MMAQNHLLMGAVIGLYINNPYLVAILSFLLHFVMDIVTYFVIDGKPGVSTKTYFNKLAEDVKYTLKTIISLQVISVVFVFVIIYQKGFLFNQNVLIGMFFSMLPDFINHIGLGFKKHLIKHHKHMLKISRELHIFIHTVSTLLLLLILLMS